MPISIGQQLKAARIDHNLSLDDVFKVTHIRVKYLEALEADDFSVMPSPAQGRGFLRLYAQHLGLDIDALLAEMHRVENAEAQFTKVDESLVGVLEDMEEETGEENLPEKENPEPFWQTLLKRVGTSLARPKPASVSEADSTPIADEPEPTQEQAKPTFSRKSVKSQVRRPVPSPVPGQGTELESDYVPDQSIPLGESQAIFRKIGATLRERRELLSLTHEEIEGHIHLRPHYLTALEAGNFSALPSPVQTRGMLSNYADFLDLDTENLLLRFAEGLQAQRLERHLETAQERENDKKRSRFSLGGFVAPDLIFGGGVIILIIAFAVWGLGRIAKNRAEVPVEATAPSISEVLMITSTVEVAVTPTETLVIVNTPGGEAGTPEPLDENITAEDLDVQILVTVLERSWLRVTVDGEIAFEGRAQPNATFVYEGNESVEVLTANGAGVRIGYNQRDMGLMGGFGEVVQRIYGARGILTPTVTPTSLATLTPTPTLTLTPSPTPIATSVE